MKAVTFIFFLFFFIGNVFGQNGVTITSPQSPGPTSVNPITVNLNFEGPVNELLISDFIINNGTLQNLTRTGVDFLYQNQQDMDRFDVNVTPLEIFFSQGDVAGLIERKLARSIISIDFNSQNELFYLTLGDGIFKVNASGTKQRVIPASEFETPLDIVINRNNGIMYVADAGAGQIFGYRLSDYSKTLTIGTGGNGERDYPRGATGLALDAVGNIYDADNYTGTDPAGIDEIKIYKSDGSLIDFITFYEGSSIENPFRIAVDKKNNIYLSDSGGSNGRILIFDENYNEVKVIQGSPQGTPGSLVVDNYGYLYVIDYKSDFNLNDLFNDPLKVIDNYETIRDTRYTIKVYDTNQDFNLVAEFGSSNLNLPVDLAIDNCGFIYVNNLQLRGPGPSGAITVDGQTYPTNLDSNFDFKLKSFQREDTFTAEIFPNSEGLIELILEDANLFACDPQPEGEFSIVYETEESNTAPAAVSDSYMVLENETLTEIAPGVLENDTDPEDDALTAQLQSNVTNGNLSLNPDGSFIYTPNANYTGIDSFTYYAYDGELNSNVVTVTINVNPEPNQAPTAVADSYSVTENQVLNEPAPGVLENDSDPEDDALTAQLQSNVTNGNLSLNPDGSFIYTPNANYIGIDSFTYYAYDGELHSNVVTVTINVNPEPNQAPIALADSYSLTENQVLNVPVPGVLENDTDPEDDVLSAQLQSNVTNGSLSLNIDGSFIYTPNANYTGIDSFTYFANDGDLDSNVVTVTINVNPEPNQAPTAVADSYSVTENQVLNEPAPGVLENDTDPENDALTAQLQSNVTNGSLSLNIDGSFIYTPNSDYTGTDSFTYLANDGELDSNVVTVNITVDPEDTPPTFDNCPENISKNNDAGQCGAVVTFATPSVSDDSGTITPTRIDSNTDLNSGDEFPVGETTITFQADDGVNDPVSCSFTITVTDTENPVISCPNEINESVAFGESGKVIIYALPSYEDNCGNGTLTQTAGLASGEEFPVGTTTNTFVVEDENGNSASCSFNVIITEEPEDTPPTFDNCPEKITKNNDSGQCDAVVTFATPTVSDDSGTIIPTRIDSNTDLNSGDEFPVGETTITFRADDGVNDPVTCSFTITVIDNEKPGFTNCPSATIVISISEGETGAVFEAPQIEAVDNCGTANVVQTMGPDGGSVLPLGFTDFEFTATDQNGQIETCSFTVEVVIEGQENLELSCPEDYILNADENCIYEVPDFKTIIEYSPAEAMIEQNIPTGTFITEDTEINITATYNDQTENCSILLDVRDEISPIITCPGDLSLNLETGENYTLPDYSEDLNATDNCGEVEIIQIPEPGSSIEDDIQITFIVSDTAGNTTSCHFDIDIIRPGEIDISCPGDITASWDENCQFVLPDYTAQAMVYNSSNQEVVQEPAAGTIITENRVEVTLSIEDENGSDSCNFLVILQDDTPPELDLKNYSVSIGPTGEALITFADIDNGSVDNCDDEVIYELSRSSFTCKQLGENLVQVTAEDSSGNRSTANTIVTVTDALDFCEDPVLGSEYIFIYPNPNTGSFRIAAPIDIIIERVEVFDHRGRFIAARNYESTTTEYAMDLGFLQEAVYVLKIISDKRTVTRRMIFKY